MAQNSIGCQAILLTGYLGAGKTTLLNRLIDAYKHLRLAVLVNEFGAIGVDGTRLNRGDYELIELNRGSLFCICVRTDFIAAVKRIGEEIKPDLLLIEATGIADTTEMERMMALPQIAASVRIKAVVCLVDPLTFGKVSTFLKAPITQVESADLVLINKADLADGATLDSLEDSLRKIKPHARITRAVKAEFPLSDLDALQHESIASGAPGTGRTDAAVSVSLSATGSITQDDWTMFRRGVAGEVLRLKGWLTLDGAVMSLDEIAGRMETVPDEDHSPGDNAIVIIGRRLNREALEAGFRRLF